MVSYRRRDEDKKEPEHVDLRGAKPFRNAYEEKARRDAEKAEREARDEEQRQSNIREAQARINRGVPSDLNYGPRESGFSKIAKNSGRTDSSPITVYRDDKPGLGSKLLGRVTQGLADTIGISKEAKANRERVSSIKAEGEQIRKAAAKTSYFKGMYELGTTQGREIALKPKPTFKAGFEKVANVANKRLNAVQGQAFSDNDFLGLAGRRPQGTRIPVQYREDIFGNPIIQGQQNTRTIITRDSLGRPVKVQERIQKIEYKHGKEIITYRKVPVKKKAQQGFDPFSF